MNKLPFCKASFYSRSKGTEYNDYITHVKYIFCEVNKVMNKLNSESKPSFEYRNRFQEPSRNRVCN